MLLCSGDVAASQEVQDRPPCEEHRAAGRSPAAENGVREREEVRKDLSEGGDTAGGSQRDAKLFTEGEAVGVLESGVVASA